MKYGIYETIMTNVTTYNLFNLKDHEEATTLGFSLIRTAKTKAEANEIMKEYRNHLN